MGQVTCGNQRGQLDKERKANQHVEMEKIGGGTRKGQEKRLKSDFKVFNNDDRINEMRRQRTEEKKS